MLQQPAAQAVGWALLHFVWQGALVGVLTAVALALLRRSAPDVRYVVATIGLSLMLTLPVVTAVQIWRAAGASHTVAAVRLPRRSPEVRASGPPRHWRPGARRSRVGDRAHDRCRAASLPQTSGRALDAVRLEPWLPLLVLAWLAGVVDADPAADERMDLGAAA